MALLDKIKELFGGREEPRDELGRHPLVVGQESDSADGATVVTLAD